MGIDFTGRLHLEAEKVKRGISRLVVELAAIIRGFEEEGIRREIREEKIPQAI